MSLPNNAELALESLFLTSTSMSASLERVLPRRTDQHPFGGADRVLPEWIRSVGGGVVADIFRDPYSVGGGVVAEIFRDPYSVARGVMAELFPLTAVTDPKFVLFKHVLCFAPIMSTLCPNVCRQTARIGGGGQHIFRGAGWCMTSVFWVLMGKML